MKELSRTESEHMASTEASYRCSAAANPGHPDKHQVSSAIGGTEAKHPAEHCAQQGLLQTLLMQGFIED